MDSESSAPRPAASEMPLDETSPTARALGVILRAGVLVSAAIVLLGVGLFAHRRGLGFVLFGSRDAILGSGENPASLRELLDDLRNNAHVPGAVTDIGLLTLMATPVLSVVVSLGFFARHREWTYVIFASLVLGMLVLGSVLGSI
ncbi:MAG TPA: DUF1634 domain-containing protein [bacterium]|nr:DUF1634 domain-containing protein [bacterium]